MLKIFALDSFDLFATDLYVVGFWEAVRLEYEAAEPPTGFQGEIDGVACIHQCSCCFGIFNCFFFSLLEFKSLDE